MARWISPPLRVVTALLLPIMLAPVASAAQAPTPAPIGDSRTQWHEAPDIAALTPADRVYGPAEAAFTVVVWLDPECPYCRILGTTPEHVIDSAGKQVNLAVRLYPLPFHGANAVLGSTAALCVAEQAGPSAYYRFLDGWLVMTGGNGRGIPGNNPATNSRVIALAAAAGASDGPALIRCTRSSITAERLKQEMAGADGAGIDGTPALAIRDNRPGDHQGRTIMIEGAVEREDLMQAINYIASKQPAAAPTK